VRAWVQLTLDRMQGLASAMQAAGQAADANDYAGLGAPANKPIMR